jgi:hypothetical protein
VKVVDIKCTSKAEKDWGLQVGALQAMLEGPDVSIYRDDRFRYFNEENEQFMSVSGVLREVGLKKSFAGLEFSKVVLHAIERGKVMENAIFAALATDSPHRLSIPESWQEELTTIKAGKKTSWIQGYWNWLDDHSPVMVECRKFVADSEARVAGEIDLVLEGDGGPAVLHLNPALKNGYKVRPYSACFQMWFAARNARVKSLASFRQARDHIEELTAIHAEIRKSTTNN